MQAHVGKHSLRPSAIFIALPFVQSYAAFDNLQK